MSKKERKGKARKTKKVKRVKRVLNHPITIGVLSTVLSTVLIAILANVIGFIKLPSQVQSIDKSLNSLIKRVEELESTTEPTIHNSSNNMENNINITVGETTSISMEGNEREPHLSSPNWSDSDIIVTKNDGTTCTAHELINEKLLLRYFDNGQEVYFYGQFNENNHWDGNCIINVYNNDILTLITEAEYDDGILLRYKQVFSYITDVEVWCFSEREHVDAINKGKSWNYYKTSEYQKTFDLNTIQIKHILNVESFKSIIDTNLEAFYHGDTSNGSYNDNTKDAYLVKYFEDGTVEALYTGIFIDGNLNDDSGDAFEILFEDSIEGYNYFYYKGVFIDGERKNDKDIKYVTQEDIDELIKDKYFDCELKWKEN